MQFKQRAWSVKRALNLKDNFQAIQRALSASPYVKNIKQISSVKLSDKHKFKRIDWAKGKLTMKRYKLEEYNLYWWKKAILDGLGGLQFYWHDPRNEPEIISTRV